MTMKDLLEQRGRIVAAMREIDASPKGQGGDLDEAQATKFDTLKGDLTAVEKRIERQTLLDDAERTMQGEPVNGGGDFALERRQCSIVKAIAHQMDPRAVDAGRMPERRLHLACGTKLECGLSACRRLVTVSCGLVLHSLRIQTHNGVAHSLADGVRFVECEA